jgi:hypothetical protein
MSRFILGIVLGCFLGIAGGAIAATVLGKGALEGWTVIDEDGETICSDPNVDAEKHEIQCAAKT